jgi:O-antigen/teichoic acid export membrane protein
MVSDPENRPSNHRPLALAAAQTYGTQLAVALLSLINVFVVARTLGPEGRGDIAFFTAIAWLLSNLATLGVQEANINLAGLEPKLRPALATNSLILAALLGGSTIGIFSGLMAIAPGITLQTHRVILWLILGSLPILVLGIYMELLIQGDYGFAVTNAAYLVPPILNVSVNAVLLLLGVLTVGSAVVTWIVGQMLATLIRIWYVKQRLAGFGLPDLVLARRTLNFGLKSHGGRIMLLGNYRLDQWILGAVAGPHRLGLYSIAVTWAETTFYLPTALAIVQRPTLVRASSASAGRQAATLFRASILFTALVVAGLILTAPYLCVTIFGSDFHGSIRDLRVLAIGAFGMVALKQFGGALTAQRRPVLATAAIGGAFVATVILDVILIPLHADFGASIASAVAYTIGGAVIAAAFSRALGTRPSELIPRGSDALMYRQIRAIRRRAPVPALEESTDRDLTSEAGRFLDS